MVVSFDAIFITGILIEEPRSKPRGMRALLRFKRKETKSR